MRLQIEQPTKTSMTVLYYVFTPGVHERNPTCLKFHVVVTQRLVSAHNEYRAKHGAAPLKLNESLMRLAQRHAQNMASRGESLMRLAQRHAQNMASRGESLMRLA